MNRREVVRWMAGLLVAVTGLASCHDGGPVYHSGGLREEGILGRAAEVRSVTSMAVDDASGSVVGGRVMDESVMRFDERGVKTLDGNEGRSGNYSMSFTPEYSVEGRLLGGEYRSGDVLLFTRRLDYDASGRVMSVVNIAPTGMISDSLTYHYDEGGYTIEGKRGNVVLEERHEHGKMVSRTESDKFTYKTEYRYDDGRLTEKIFYGVADTGGTSEEERVEAEQASGEVSFIAEYEVNYVYDKGTRLAGESRRNLRVKDDFDHTTEYEYRVFDSVGNWLQAVKRTVYEDGSHVEHLIERTITYHP